MDIHEVREKIKYPITRQMIARYLVINQDTLLKRMDEWGITRYRRLTPIDVEMIREKLFGS